jgi:hypothetical protein
VLRNDLEDLKKKFQELKTLQQAAGNVLPDGSASQRP